MAEPVYWIILVATNIPIYLGVGRVLFNDFEDFMECIRYSLTPDLWSWLNGKGMEDWNAEMKLTSFFVVSGLIVFGEHWLLSTYIF